MKRFLAFAVVSVLLASCGGGGDSRNCSKDYDDGEIMLCLPSGWEIVEKSTLEKRGIPEDAMVAFQAEEPIAGQFPTVVVTKEPLKRTVDPGQYSEASMRSVAIFSAYKEVDVTDVKMGDDTVKLHIFTAQPVAEEPLRKFYQLSTVHGSNGYTVTGTTPVAITDSVEEEVIAIVKSMTFVVTEGEDAENN